MGKLSDQRHRPVTIFKRYKPPLSTRGPRNLQAFSRQDWGQRNSEQNTNIRTIRFKKESLGSNTIRTSPNTSAEREIPPSAGTRSKLGGLSPRCWSSN